MNKALRMAPWFFISVAITVVIGMFAPQQLLVSLYKLSLIVTAGYVGYWLDRGLFPYARPHDVPMNIGNAFAAAMLRRAIIVGCAMIAAAIGA